MFRPRVIPVLLLKNAGLVKSVQFKNHHYIGDPINAVKIFNDLKADELVFLDILASKENRLISLDFVEKVGEESNMPFAVGGGVKSIDDIKKIISAGAEKVVINQHAAAQPDFIKEATETFGSSTIVICVDIKRNFWGKQRVYTHNGKKAMDLSILEYVQLIEEKGAGEVIIQSIDNDGVMKGYDLPMIKKIAETVKIPVVALGGAGNVEHLKQAYHEGYANGLAAGSMFVYHGTQKGVLINYPEKKERVF